ncbi:hypothetical protein D3C72_194830 [compost metagenome]
MAGRPKIQFADDAKGKEAWELIEKIQEAWYKEDLKDFEMAIENIRGEWPEAKVKASIPKISAGEIVLRLLRNEAESIERNNK